MNQPTTRPLVTELNETLVCSNLTLETFWSAFRHNPFGCLVALLGNLFDPEAQRQHLSAIGPVDVSLLPYNKAVLAACAEAQSNGAKVYVSTFTDRELAERIVACCNEVDELLPPGDVHAADGNKRSTALMNAFAPSGFDYIGMGTQDIPVWQKASTALVARPAPSLSAALQAKGIAARALGYRWKMRDMIRGLRPHQWLKNLLLFLPLIAAHQLDAENALAVVFGIICFSAAASSIYIVNDLLDLDADRRHPTKRNRVFAAGKVPIRIGMAASLLLAVFAGVLAANMAGAMFVVVLAYLALTLAYSVFFKRFRWADLVVLASLYGLRVIAGAIAAGVPASPWLMAFVMPAFLALSAVKRLTELRKVKNHDVLPGRAYRPADRGRLLYLALVSAAATVALFLSYTATGAAAALYEHLWQLRLMAVPMALWFGHMILTGWKGSQNYDPMVFALRDPVSLTLLTVVFLLVGSAS